MTKEYPIIPYIMMSNQAQAQLDYYMEKGVNRIEIGVPFSDPMADGPIIQAAGQEAIEEGHNLYTALDFIRLNRVTYPHVRFVLMTYLNPIYQMGYQTFFEVNSAHSLIIPDLSLTELEKIHPLFIEYQVAYIPLLALDTPEERIKRYLACGDDFVYLMASKAITGHQAADAKCLRVPLDLIRSFTHLPLAIGFGVRERQQIESLLSACDFTIMGSHLIDLWHKGAIDQLDMIFKAFP